MTRRQRHKAHSKRRVKPVMEAEKKILSEIGFMHATIETYICRADQHRDANEKIQMQDVHDLIHKVLYRSDLDNSYQVLDVSAAELVTAWVSEVIALKESPNDFHDYITLGNAKTKAQLYEIYEIV